ncbi:UDP-3-O-(3-hydroxymyristoyl)glucosamine N-acyltransferase [Enterovirga sp.]|jgi:UDP-3-O-[3-hydroxymyristoyl] glucosamine N-acyltransferase|uniref:UDP-3-O-(3-hydroxymyristoyl)glucosamine N-acyltransferase n=1 Tax=Enterovirga sp. TaxID=2026350 RepID=UPI0026210CDD|nr:UDP-3-O-(3-hydroxymyristoyl)glucosamine N-acyltransferase [Enterovirga sp.]MDB5591133.1 UDP-3-O-(3-hydroxymyristoyl) glucosamine N-acyltransferase [Enterovirga sp.]
MGLAEIAALAGIEPPVTELSISVDGVASLEEAGPRDLSYMDNARYLGALAATRAGLCLVSARFAPKVPSGTVALVVPEPYRTYAAVLGRFHPDALRPGSVFGASGISPGSSVHPSARLESGVTVDPGAVIGPGTEIGRGSVIGAGAVVGPGCRIGRDCSIGPQVSVLNALIGDRVTLHPGVRIGQDGFGYALGRGRHLKVAQIGRVVIQDDVEIGANTTVDRGATRDTVIGEGTKIDNLVQIAHNVVIGRHCIIVSQTGISGSATLEDYVVLAGQVGVVGHLRIGAGSQIAGSSNVNKDVPPGSRWGGTPAKPVREWFREMTTLKTLAARRGGQGGEPDAS